jgi:hypothetical protein
MSNIFNFAVMGAKSPFERSLIQHSQEVDFGRPVAAFGPEFGQRRR